MRKMCGAVFIVFILSISVFFNSSICRAENDFVKPELNQACRNNALVLKQKYPDKTILTDMSFGISGGAEAALSVS